MTTPTPSSAAKYATPSAMVQTPRSIPSPAMSRHQPPAAPPSRTTPARLGGGGVPMMPSLSQASAASGASLRGPSPAGTGLLSVTSHSGIAGLGLLGMASPNAIAALEGITPLGLRMHEVGAGAAGAKRDDEEVRRAKVGRVLETIGGWGPAGFGRVSDEGVRRVGRWAGFDVEVESKYEGKEWEGDRPIVIAGRNAVLLDVGFKQDRVDKVEVTFTSEDEHVVAHAADAARVLREDLAVPPGVAAINTKLDRFAANLQVLAGLDKLSSQSANCVDAITGLYASLKRLYEHETAVALALYGPDQRLRAERSVVRAGSCKPGMHLNRKIGLSLQYWCDGSSPVPAKESPASTGADGQVVPDRTEDIEDGAFFLDLGVETNDLATFPAMRISKDWVSEGVVKPSDIADGQTTIDWLDPPALAAMHKPDDMSVEVDPSKTPQVRFVATLTPPVTMPSTVAAQILQSVGLTTMPNAENPTSYQATLLKSRGADEKAATDQACATATHDVFVPGPDIERDVTHRYNLFVPKPEYAYELRRIPFSHPRQLVQVLPTLRKWACAATLLKRVFDTPVAEEMDKGGQKSNAPAVVEEETRSIIKPVKLTNGKKIALDVLMAGDKDEAEDVADPAAVSVDVNLSTVGDRPSMAIFFPLEKSAESGIQRAGSVRFDILLNGRVSVSELQPAISRKMNGNGAHGNEMEVDRPNTAASSDGDTLLVGRALESVADLGVWLEWLRAKYT